MAFLPPAAVTATVVGADAALMVHGLAEGEPPAMKAANVATEVAEVAKTYHRLGDSAENIASIKSSGQYKGNAPTNILASDIPKAQAYDGPLPDGNKGFEFTTTAKPDSGQIPGQPTWSGNGHNPDVQTINDQAVIPVTVTKINE